MHVRALWRYPVKSLVGERLDAVEVDARGVVGDRLWSVRDEDGKLGSGKTTRRFRRMDGLLALSAAYDGDVPIVTFPDGRRLRGDDVRIDAALSAHVGREVTLGKESTISHFDEGPIHLMTEASRAEIGRTVGRDVDARRFRANIIVETDEEGLLEDRWIGSHVAVGADVVFEIKAGMTRCVMVDLAQVGLGREEGVLRAIVARNDSRLGVVADVRRGGDIRVGDAVRVMLRP